MAKYGSGSVGFLLVGGYSLLASDVFEFNGPIEEAIAVESTGLGDSWVEHLPSGVRKLMMSQSGLFDDAANGVSDAFVDANQTERIVCVNLTGNTIGQKFIGIKGAFGMKVTRVGQRADLHRLNVEYRVTGAKDEGVILQALAAKTADWNTEGADSQDAGASSADGGAGYLQVSAFSGFSGFIGKIRHSSDDSTYADLITFTDVTSAPNAQRVTVSGTVNQHLAFDGNVTGTGSITVMAGFARG